MRIMWIYCVIQSLRSVLEFLRDAKSRCPGKIGFRLRSCSASWGIRWPRRRSDVKSAIEDERCTCFEFHKSLFWSCALAADLGTSIFTSCGETSLFLECRSASQNRAGGFKFSACRVSLIGPSLAQRFGPRSAQLNSKIIAKS